MKRLPKVLVKSISSLIAYPFSLITSVFADDAIGTITPPASVPDPGADPTTYVAGLIRAGVSLLLVVAFVIFFIWTILAGLRFVFAGGDSKNISAAWSQIYWGLIGMVVVMGAFAIVKLVETFFGVTIFTNFQLPSAN